MNILITFSFFFCTMLGATLFFKGKYREQAIYVSVPLLFLAFNLSLSSGVYRIVGENLKNYINTATLVIIALCLILFNRNSLKISWEYIYFIPLFAQCIYFYCFTSDIYNLPNFIRQTLNYFSIYLCFVIGKSIKKVSLEAFFNSFNVLAIFNGVLGIAQMITKKTLLIGNFNSSILYTEGVVNGNRAVGIAGSNNSAGNLAALLFVIIIFNLVWHKSWYSFIALVLNVVFAILTQTRIGLLAIAITFLIIFIDYKPKTRNGSLIKQILFSMLAILGVIVLIVLGDKIINVLFTSRGNTAGERFIQYGIAWRTAIENHPLMGIGPGQWRSFLYGFYQLVDIPIHSQYLNFFVENGVFILILNIIFNFGILLSCIKKLNRFINLPGRRNLRLFVYTFFMANLIVSNFNPNQIYTLNNIIYYLVIFVTEAYINNTNLRLLEEENMNEHPTNY